jgi:hypothetical protein
MAIPAEVEAEATLDESNSEYVVLSPKFGEPVVGWSWTAPPDLAEKLQACRDNFACAMPLLPADVVEHLLRRVGGVVNLPGFSRRLRGTFCGARGVVSSQELDGRKSIQRRVWGYPGAC